jgi:hypothetical protein
MATTLDTTRMRNVHDPAVCEGRGCPVHHPSDHPMADWPARWRGDRGVTERVCRHGVGHPDPDDMAYRKAAGHRGAQGIHGCDGCC